MNLYRVTLKGMTVPMGTSVAYGVAYVVADDPTAAYQKVRDSLDKEDLGFGKDRALDRVELLAEGEKYPDCGYRLYA